VQHALAQTATNVKEVAVEVEAHGLYDSKVLTSARLERCSKLELARTESLEDLDHRFHAPLSRLAIAKLRPSTEPSLFRTLASKQSLLLPCLSLSTLLQPDCVLVAQRVSKIVHSVDGLVLGVEACSVLSRESTTSYLLLLHVGARALDCKLLLQRGGVQRPGKQRTLSTKNNFSI
jgi:hypothetical protein